MSIVNSRILEFITGKRFLLSGFRLLALTVALVELVTGDEYISVPWIIPATGAVLYTGFKIAHPLRWHQSKLLNTTLMTIDVLVCAALTFIPGQIHGPFALYTLAPVLTSALLLPLISTFIIAGTTLAYYSVIYFSFPLELVMENVSSIFATYLVALGLISILPYIINSFKDEQLQCEAMLRERLRLSHEIHDGLCQDICGLRWQVQLLRRDTSLDTSTELRLTQLEGMLIKAEMDVRGSIEALCSFEGDRSLRSQIEHYLDNLKSNTGIDYQLIIEGKEPKITGLTRLEVLSILGEALRNVVKHAQARNVTVRVRSLNGRLQVNVTDDGCGINNDKLFMKGHGMTVMKERAEALGGWLKVNSLPGQGTEIQLEVPHSCLT